jgi:AcrR family transcriptional regulator
MPTARPSPKPAKKPPAPRPYHHGDLRESLLDVAARWLDERGAATLTLRELAKAAGVSHAAPYHHFAGLDALLAGVAERAFARLADAMAAAAGAAPDAGAAMVAIAESYVRTALAHPAQFRLMFGPTLAAKDAHPGLKAQAERAFGVLARAAEAYAPGEGLELALSGWSLVHGLSHLLVDDAFSGLPLAASEAAALRRLAPAALARRMGLRLLRPQDARRLGEARPPARRRRG